MLGLKKKVYFRVITKSCNFYLFTQVFSDCKMVIAFVFESLDVKIRCRFKYISICGTLSIYKGLIRSTCAMRQNVQYVSTYLLWDYYETCKIKL